MLDVATGMHYISEKGPVHRVSLTTPSMCAGMHGLTNTDRTWQHAMLW